MARSTDTLVEIPPPETPHAETRSWGVVVTALAMIIGLALLVSITRPRLPPVEWARQRGPTGAVNLDSLVATADGFALLSGMTADGVVLWSSADGATWRSQSLQGAPSQLAAVADRLVAHGVRVGRFVLPVEDGWSESSENMVFPAEVRSRQGSGRPSLVGNPDGLLAMSLFGDVWWTPDGGDFERVVTDPSWGPGTELPFDSECRPPTRTSPDVPPIVVTDSGFVAMISSNPAEPFGIWPVCEPQVWLSNDGRSWTESDTTLGDDAYVYNLGWREGSFTAVGGFGIGQPAAWTSTDGREWELIPSFTSLDGLDLYTVETGPAGWVILGKDSEQSGTVGWTSVDGHCWVPLPWFVTGTDSVVGTGHLIVLDRTSYPELWQGSITGGNGSCR